MALSIRHDVPGRRFVTDVDGHLAECTYVEQDGGVVVFDHTYVPPELRGGGVAGKLVAHALDWARASGLRVVPACSYVAAYIRRHPEYGDMLA